MSKKMKNITLEMIKENKTLGPMFRLVKKLKTPFTIPEYNYPSLEKTLMTGKFQELDFSDPQLVAKLYGAALESMQPIPENVLVTALMLAWGRLKLL